MFKSISLHPRLVALVDSILNVSMFVWLSHLKIWWLLIILFILRQLFWLIFIRLMYYPMEAIRWRHWLSLFIFSLGIISFLVFVEKNLGGRFLSASWYILSVLFIIIVFFSFWFLPTSRVGLVAFFKPHLRWRFIMTALGLAGIFSGVGAIISFQIVYQVTNWVWFILAALISTGIAGWWWWEYGLKYNKQFLIWLLIHFILVLELLWIVAKLPFGHLVSGLLLIWLWYILWLLIRFNLTSQGIIWRKQAKFLLTNLVLFVLFLFFVVRWK